METIEKTAGNKQYQNALMHRCIHMETDVLAWVYAPLINRSLLS